MHTSGNGDLAADLAAHLTEVVGDTQVLVEPDMRAPFEVDWTRRFGGPALAVVRPGTTEEVAGVVRACATRRVGVVVQGGNTGLVGGGVRPRTGGRRRAPAGTAAPVVVLEPGATGAPSTRWTRSPPRSRPGRA